jgi:hypothetical protein
MSTDAALVVEAGLDAATKQHTDTDADSGLMLDAAVGGIEPELRVTYVGDAIYVTASAAQPIYIESCSQALRLEKRKADGSWGPLLDQRFPSSSNPGYYLDGLFIAPSMNNGCDVVACSRLSAPMFVARAEEYIRNGSKEPPLNSSVTESTVPSIESRAFSGAARIHLAYSTEASCGAMRTTVLEFEVPSQGVCCPHGPSGDEGCAGGAPVGGWAPSLDECDGRDAVGPIDGWLRLDEDSRGCPKLKSSRYAPWWHCCGDCNGDDAGI